jgi:hypothetical protein
MHIHIQCALRPTLAQTTGLGRHDGRGPTTEIRWLIGLSVVSWKQEAMEHQWDGFLAGTAVCVEGRDFAYDLKHF